MRTILESSLFQRTYLIPSNLSLNSFYIRLVTDSMAELEDSPELDAFIKRIKLWVSEQAGVLNTLSTFYSLHLLDPTGKNIPLNSDPSPTVYADDKHDNFPLVPITRGLKTAELQKILRLVFTLLWGKLSRISTT